MKTNGTVKVHPFRRNGEAMRRLRKRAGISQERLAVTVGTTRRHMIRLENGEHLPSAPLRDRIAAEIGADRSSIQSADEEDEESSMPLTRDEFTMLGALMSRLGASLPVEEGGSQ